MTKSKLQVSRILNNVHSIEHVAEIINDKTFPYELPPNKIAGEYAYNAFKESGIEDVIKNAKELEKDAEGFEAEYIEAEFLMHLDWLKKAGAVFDSIKAANYAMRLQKADIK